MTREFLTDVAIIESVKGVQIPKEKLVVVGGAALQLFGIKRTNDIDAIIPIPTLIERIRHRTLDRWDGRSGMHSRIDREKITSEGLEFTILDWVNFYDSASVGKLALLPPPNDKLYSVSFEELRDEAVSIQGLLVSPPERILDWKQSIGRAKDQPDIDRIQAYLARSVERI